MDQLALLIPQSASQAPSRTREVRDTRATTSEKDFAKTFESTLKQADKAAAQDKNEKIEKSEVPDKQEQNPASKTDEAETSEQQTSGEAQTEAKDAETEPLAEAIVTDPLVAILVPEALLGTQGPQSPQVTQPPQQAQTAEASAGMVQASELMKIAPTDLNIKEITVIKGLPADAGLKLGDQSFAQQLKVAGEVPAAAQEATPVPNANAVGTTVNTIQTAGTPNIPLTQVAQAQVAQVAQPLQAEVQPVVVAEPSTVFKLDTPAKSETKEQVLTSVETEVAAPVLVKNSQQNAQADSQDPENAFGSLKQELEGGIRPKKAEKSKEQFEIAEAPQKAELKAKVEVTQEVKESVPAQVVRQTREAFGKGRTEIRIQLNPETLGGLTLKVSHQDGIVRANIVADSPQTKELLESQLASLKNQFAEQGLRVERIEVVAKNPMGFESSLDQRQQTPHQQQQQRRQVPHESLGTSNTASIEGAIADAESSGSLDVKA